MQQFLFTTNETTFVVTDNGFPVAAFVFAADARTYMRKEREYGTEGYKLGWAGFVTNLDERSDMSDVLHAQLVIHGYRK